MRAIIFLSAFSIISSPMVGAIAKEKERFVVPTEIRGDGKVPLCDNPKVLAKITKRFHKTNVKYRHSELAFDRIEHVKETDHLTNPSDETDRRFCKAHVHLTNGTHPKLYYLIQERDGIASITPGVDFCVSGHDPERAHGDNCRSLRVPF
ncbi:MAG: hypothetical protein ABJN24_07845 [Hyphomicrobiales bacterium]